MNLSATVSLYASSISKAVRDVFNKKTGKQKGLDSIEDELTSISKNAAGGDLSDDELNEFLETRKEYMKNAFSKLNAPMKDKSEDRVDLIDDTESKAAKWFGETKGHSKRGTKYKVWVDHDGCEICVENSDEGAIPIEDDFPSGDYAPPAHPNCECDLEYTNDPDDDDE